MSHSADWQDIWLIDVEASSLGGWPIELAAGNVVRGEVHAWLIRSIPAWRIAPWGRQAQRLHGLTERMVETRGRSPDDVARRLSSLIGAGRVVATDPEFDGRWLGVLLATGGIPPMTLIGWDKLLAQSFEAKRVSEAVREVSRNWEANRRRLHRAGADVLRLMCVGSHLLGIPWPTDALQAFAPARVLSALWTRAIANGEEPCAVWRRELGLTIDQVAAATGLSPVEIEHVEAGRRPSGDELYLLADAYMIDVADIDPRP